MLHVLLFLGTFLLGILLAFTKNPAFAFSLYESIFFFNPAERWWTSSVPALPYSLIVVLVFFTVFLSNFKYAKLNNPFQVPQLRWMYVLVFMYLVVNLWAVFPAMNMDFSIIYLKLAVVVTLAFMLCTDEKKLDLYLYGYLYGSWYISVLTYQIGRNSGIRVEGIGTPESGDANFTAASIAPSLIFAFYYFWKYEKKWQKLIFAIVGVVILNGLILINSRGSILGVAAGMMFFFYHLYFSEIKKKYQRFTVIFIILVGLAGVLRLADSSFTDRMLGIKDQAELSEEKTSGSTRVFFWLAAMDMAKDYPFGKGVNAFYYYSPFYIPESVNVTSNSKSVNRAVHSTWFELLTEVGYLGVLAFILMLMSSFKSLTKCQNLFKSKNDIDRYYKIIAIKSSIITFMVAMTFINRARGEVLYWLIMYSAVVYNIYVLKAGNYSRLK